MWLPESLYQKSSICLPLPALSSAGFTAACGGAYCGNFHSTGAQWREMDFCVKSLPPCLWNYLHYYLKPYWKKCDWKRNSLCWIRKSEALRILLVDLWRLDISVWVISVYRDTLWCSLAREMNDETQGLLTYIRPANGIIIADCSCKLCGWQHFSLNFEQCQQWDC